MTKYKKPDWAISQTIRYDREGMVEDICKHGCGHPNKEWCEDNPRVFTRHGCCLCCQIETTEKKGRKKDK